MPEMFWRSLVPAFCAWWLSRRGQHVFRNLPHLPRQPSVDELPPLSIVIPARNEAQNLAAVLPTLMTVQYPGALEVIVVDDNSTDRTAEVAERNGARVIRLDSLPAGWLGKPHACHRGAAAAQGEWLLFADADVFHDPAGPAAAVAAARSQRLDGLSLFLRQRTRTDLERVVLMTAFSGLFTGHLPGQPLLNGQYLLIRNQTYQSSGGFGAVRDEPLEDLALAKELMLQGYQVPMLRGEWAAEVWMYRSPAHLWTGMTRISAGSLRWFGWGALLSMAQITAAVMPLLGLISARRRREKAQSMATWLSVSAGYFSWSRWFGSMPVALFAPLGALFVQLAATAGLLSSLLGRGVYWKGRRMTRAKIDIASWGWRRFKRFTYSDQHDEPIRRVAR